jgi:hypothetical protein
VPSLWEDFILRNRRILADQMEFLMAHLPKNFTPGGLRGRSQKQKGRLATAFLLGAGPLPR